MKNKKLLFLLLGFVILTGLCVLFLVKNSSLEAAVNDTYQMDGSVLMRYNGNESSVTVPRNVTEIAPGAFEGNDFIKKVYIPLGITKIGYSAFAECPNLSYVEIGSSVTEIGSSCFANCPSLLEFKMGMNVSEMGSGVFAGDVVLTDIDIDEDNNNFVCLDGVLYTADRSTIIEMLPGRDKNFYDMNDNVTGIYQYAFWGCDNLNHVSLSTNLEEIPPYSFSNAKNLRSVSMSFKTKRIGMKAFEDCVTLAQIFLPDSIEYIHETAFDGCNVIKLYTSELSYGYFFANEHGYTLLDKPEYSLEITTELADELAKKRAEEAQNQEDAFDIDIDEILNDNKDVLGQTTIVNDTAVILMDKTAVEVVSGDNVKWNDTLKERIVDGKIPENLFYLKTDLKEIEIPDGTTEIGDFSFARSGLTEVVIPEGVQTIGLGAFYHCNSLDKVEIPSTVTSVGKNAFTNTKWYKDWLASGESDYLVVGDGCLIGYKGDDDSFVLPSDVKNFCCDIPE